MKELKIIKHTTYTYETSDGSVFDDKKEAEIWQNLLSNIEDVCMLDGNYEPTKNIDCAIYIHIKAQEQAEAFNAIQRDIGLQAGISGVGYWRYDDIADEYVNVENEIKELQNIITKLKEGGDR